MAEDKSIGTGITAKEFGRRFRKALSVPFLLNNVCSANVTEFVNAYATSLGCSEKTFFFPLLTCAAACMGTNCYIELSSLWREPPIIWTLVITPRSLLRIDVAEHLKNILLNVQQDLWTEGQQEDTKDHLKKFIFDLFSLDQLQEMLKLSKGHGFGIYNSIRSLHKCMTSPDDTDIMHRLHYGLGWFADSRVTRSTLTSTRVNLSIISTPPVVQQTLNTALSFQELFYQCFLTVCAEENYVKFGELCTPPETEKLKEIFFSIMKLHSSKPIVYKLTTEACEKFGQIHDELTDKAKQMVRKNIDHKVFQPALSYLGRLSCVLHVLDNMIESIKYKVPITPLTWNTEISAATVWHARELLGHIVEQRHALMEPTTIVSVQKVQRIDLVDGQESISRSPQTPQLVANMSPMASSPHISPGVTAVRRPVNVMNSPKSPRMISARRNLMNNIVTPQANNQFDARRNLMNNIVTPQANNQFDALLNNNNNNLPVVTPCITSISSAGIPVANKKAVVTTRQNASVNTGFNLPQSLSVSVSDEVDNSQQPCLLSRTPYTSILDLSNDDFLRTHKSSIQKILTHGVSPISPSRCVQLKLIFDPTATDNTQKYSLSFARTFLKKLEKMQFGVCEGPKNGNLRHFLFKKKKFSALTNDQMKLLCDLGINEKDYSKCFNAIMRRSTQNGSVVCLE